MNFLHQITSPLLDGQHGHPKGIIGRVLGERMVQQHVPETLWTLSLLDLQATDQILELGFGAGKAIELAASQATSGHVSGLDHSQAMVRSASRRNSKNIKAGRVSLYQGDVTILPFANEQFDKVFTIQTFYFWPDPQRTLAEIFRVLKPGAMLVITLSTGTTGTDEASGLERYQSMLENLVIPGMQKLGFARASIQQGPDSRQFKTAAVVGVK